MRLASALCALILVISSAAFAPAQENPTDRAGGGEDVLLPQVALPALTHDFGDVRPGTTLRWAFKVKNIGTANLRIRDVKPG